ncbi:MAG: T9SS type A sorting domain-containing protein [Bacteroidales bacterium]|nr:T9SS type A sorting domain-containing protein [Bacteroidales bacterium]
MKKTLMTVLCLAMGASCAFAQTNLASRNAVMQMKAAQADASMPTQQANYKASIFTKDGNELHVWDFSAENAGYTVGVVAAGASDSIGGVVNPAHTQRAAHSQWTRWADTTGEYLNNTFRNNQSNPYPVTVGTNRGFRSLNGFNSETPRNGFMVMTMQDQISDWGGTGNSGIFNSYIAFAGISTEGADVIDVTMYQYYRKFNADRCMIDFSTDSASWDGVEINVRGVDVQTNSTLNGNVTVTLPTSIANKEHVYLRIRWMSNSAAGGAYGYLWMLDDVKVIAGAANRVRVYNSAYMEGFYAQMPKGLELPMVWYSSVINVGTTPQTDVRASVYTYNNVNTTPVERAYYAYQGQFAPSARYDSIVPLLIDPYGFLRYDPARPYHPGNLHSAGFFANDPVQEYDASATVHTYGTTGSLPTDLSADQVGYVYANITTASMTDGIGNGKTFDTIPYRVSQPSENGILWGRDNGILIHNSYFAEGMTSDGYMSGDPENTGWSEQNYRLTTRFVTGSNIPEGWVIRGIQLVPASRIGMATADVELAPIIWKDDPRYSDVAAPYDSMSIGFDMLETGAGNYVVTSEDLNALSSDSELPSVGYRKNGDYKVINIMFPEQPELEPNTSYRVGYQLPSGGLFSVAASTNTGFYQYTQEDTHFVRFDTVDAAHGFAEDMTSYRRTFSPRDESVYGVFIYDPIAPDGQQNRWINIDEYPMIRLLVGPEVEIAKKRITFTCGANGYWTAGEIGQSICDSTILVAVGSTHSYYAMGDTNYQIDKIYDGDGNEVEYETDTYNNSLYGIINLENIQEDMSFRCTFTKAGIDPAAAVSLKLQPNPATSNVQLKVEGVSGMITYAIIDMSGRVVATATTNADQVTNINVSNLSKGAYFIRVTNDKFSKVEKLIVR